MPQCWSQSPCFRVLEPVVKSISLLKNFGLQLRRNLQDKKRDSQDSSLGQSCNQRREEPIRRDSGPEFQVKQVAIRKQYRGLSRMASSETYFQQSLFDCDNSGLIMIAIECVGNDPWETLCFIPHSMARIWYRKKTNRDINDKI